MEPNGRKWGAIVMLMGEYNHTIDAKGRLIVPAKFREVLGDEFVVTKGLDNCLFVYPNDEWQKFEAELKSGAKTAGCRVSVPMMMIWMK